MRDVVGKPVVPVPSPERLAIGKLRPIRVEQRRFLYFRFADARARLRRGPRLSVTQFRKDRSFIFRFDAKFEKS